jgi:L-alanine-DL-glutamate epimerase-like enolase superfamily enzyme
MASCSTWPSTTGVRREHRMRIVAVHEQTIPLSAASRNASISFDAMTASALAIVTDAAENGRPLTGIAFDSIGRYGHGGLLRERFIPRLLAADPDEYADGGGGIDPEKIWAIVMRNEKPGGPGERSGAVGLIDAAAFDLAAKRRDMPLWAYLAQRYGRSPENIINVYASGGHYRADDDIGQLREDIRRAIARGHRRFKIKIGGIAVADDVRRIEAVLMTLEPGMSLAIDGNGTFSRETAFAYAEALAGHPLAWIEEPVHPLDYELHRDLASRFPCPIATGENLFSADDARNLLRHGGLRPDRDILQFDISLSYGIVEYRRILDTMSDHGWRRTQCAPHAGHLFAFNVVAGFGLGCAEAAIDEGALFGKLTSAVTVTDGMAILPDRPGTGLEASPAFSDIFSSLIH